MQETKALISAMTGESRGFFDEAHLLFKEAPKALLDKVEQVVRLIRSKGVSVWFISQSPSDMPDSVLGQIGNRVQHALRAYTPKDQKALRAAAQSFRANKNFDTEEVLQAVGVGDALVSVLDEKGIPGIVQKANILPPRSSMAAAGEDAIQDNIDDNPLKRKYENTKDRESAYEILQEEAEEQREQEEKEAKKAAKEAAKKSTAKKSTSTTRKSTTKKSKSAFDKVVTSAANTVGRELGKKLVRGILGSLK